MIARVNTKPLLFAIAAFAVCFVTLAADTKPVVPYNPEQVKGNVRVVLLQVGRTTVFSDVGFRDTKPQKIHAIPGVSVVYVVELLGEEPIKHWNFVGDGKLVLVNGKPLDNANPENLAGGGHNERRAYEQYNWGIMKKPAVSNPKRTSIYEVWIRGVQVPNGKVDLQITTGFNDHKETFVFKEIPVE